MNKTLDKANSSIQDFAQVRLLEFKKAEQGYELPLEQEKEKTDDSAVATAKKKKKVVGILDVAILSTNDLTNTLLVHH